MRASCLLRQVLSCGTFVGVATFCYITTMVYSRVVTVSVSKLSTDYAPVIPCASLATKRCRPRPAIHAPTHAHRVTLCPLSHMPLTGLSRLLLACSRELAAPLAAPPPRRAAHPPTTHSPPCLNMDSCGGCHAGQTPALHRPTRQPPPRVLNPPALRQSIARPQCRSLAPLVVRASGSHTMLRTTRPRLRC